MSSAGTVPAWVIAKQQKAIERQQEAQRKIRVRAELTKVADRVHQSVMRLDTEEHRAWAKDEFEFIEHVLESTSEVADADVDFVLQRLYTAEAMVGQISALAQAREDEHRRSVELKKTTIVAATASMKFLQAELTQSVSSERFDHLVNRLHDLEDALETSTPVEVEAQVEAIKEEAEALREADHRAAVDEELRRHIITAVVNAMTELGFVVGNPKLLRETGNVAVVGRTPAGRSIRFDVRASGEMEFDMDGFKDRTCSDQLDDVLLMMETRFGVESGPVQHQWKNPDRISKGSKGFPTGGNTKSMGGGR